ncbi:hypothetical protein DAPK24_036070 [Pichia kluyveri]|uniref:t-SNARE coiled-coil homology domain-containing protein n=1 Tax=Pichia kluyveri TaxID=36015 RepID=A0AAV5R7U8_PICKL|nr:hypothetical protein DAPK24_036070 [Pichia kluyveri]
MDPFDTLYASTTPLIEQLNQTSPQSLDFLTLQNEIVSCIKDLQESIKMIENPENLLINPFSISSDELNSRKEKIKSLNNQLNNILNNKNISNLKGGYGINPFKDDIQSDVDNELQSNSQLDDPIALKEYHQQLLQQQDDLISNELTNTINNLHKQAITINDELNYQQDIINDVDDRMERLNIKILNNGMKKINKFMETNEMGGNCCIAILITVLIIILVLLLIV